MIFAMVGLRMASPYLVIGVFTKALRLLPKPGAWMERFEQAMGLVLLATVIYLLSFTAWANVLPAVTLLLGLGAACWWIGQIPFTADFHVKVRGWIGATAFVVLCGLFAFTGKTTIRGSEAFGLPGEVYGLRGIMEYRLERYVAQQAALHGTNDDLLDSPEITQHTTAIRWQPYSEQQLQRLIAANRTVLVDFTADWCLTCKTLEATVLDTQEVRDALRANGVVALQADWTNGDPEISQKLESLGGKQVPVVAIFPAGRAQQLIVLSGFYTKGTLLQKLQAAGPSAAALDVRVKDVGLVQSSAGPP
jgi:thiol:disulfide interchange protein DsbD